MIAVSSEEFSSAPQGPQGWQARLELRFEHEHMRTRITRRRHEGPLVVQKALYPEVEPEAGEASGSNPCHVYFVHPPGGVAGGDRLQLDVSLRRGSHALLTTPAAGKYYRCGPAGKAQMMQSFDVEGATLEWLPQENIFYPNAAVELRSIVNLSSESRFLGWEIACLGLPACRLSLEGGKLRLGFELWKDGRPLLIERLIVARPGLDARWGMAGRTAFGTALFYPANRQALAVANATAAVGAADVTTAFTLVDGVLACRAVAHRGDHLKRVFVHIWHALRPLLLGREAVNPRVWAT